jgi:hypothetical protein
VNSQLSAKFANGKVQSVDMSYPRSAVHQYLKYGAMYGSDIQVSTGSPTKAAAARAAEKKAASGKDAAEPK